MFLKFLRLIVNEINCAYYFMAIINDVKTLLILCKILISYIIGSYKRYYINII